jgi:hypothetical protein
MEAVVIYFKGLCQHLSEKTEDNRQSQHLVSVPEYPIRNPLTIEARALATHSKCWCFFNNCNNIHVKMSPLIKQPKCSPYDT